MASSPLLQDHYPCPSRHGNRKNIWESAPEQSIKPGGRPITRPQQSGAARSTPPGLYLFINSHLLLCNQEANAALNTAPHPHLLPFSLPQSFHFISSSPLCPPLSVPTLYPLSVTMPCSQLLCALDSGTAGVEGWGWGRSPGGGWLVYLVSKPNSEQARESLSGDLLSRARCHEAPAGL